MGTQTLNLQKELDLRKQKVLDLSKQVGLQNQKARVVLVIDHSGSMEHQYSNGKVQELVERLLPIGMVFDDNGEVECYRFDNECKRMKKSITTGNIAGYVDKEVFRRSEMAGTSYAPVVKSITKDFIDSEGSGLLGLGKKKYKQADTPVYVIFITDGDNDDKPETEKAIVEASSAGVFFQFVGIGKSSFPFLEKLDKMEGRLIDNANFFSVDDLSKKTDDELYKSLLTEFPAYVMEARAKGLIK